MTFSRRVALKLALAMLLLRSFTSASKAQAPAPAPAQPQRARVTFVLTNDIYQMGEQPGPDGRPRGGFARLAAVVNAERNKGVPVIFAHAGDTLSPSLMSGIDKGEHIMALTNMIAPDIFVPGNHEYDFGKDNFLTRMAEAKFPLFCANMRDAQGQAIAGFKDRSIVTLGGIRIGLTGATEEEAVLLSNPGDLKFSPSVAAIEEQAAALRREGADMVVAVVHTDRAKDEEMLRNRSADLILSGHDHDLWLNYDGRNAGVESSSDAHFVTMVDVTIMTRMNEGRREVVWRPQFRIVDTADVTPDPAVLAKVKEYEGKLAQELGVPLAGLAVELDSRTASVRTREAAIGNLFADALRVTNNADVAIMNGGGIRANKVYPSGSAFTRRDVMAELVFGNKVAVLEVSGKALRAGLENGFSLLPRAAGRFPQVSGMTIEADLSRPAGQRITAVKVGGAPLDEGKTYKLATNDFLARGGDGYASFAHVHEIVPGHDGPLMANEVMEYLQKIATVRTGVEGRITLK